MKPIFVTHLYKLIGTEREAYRRTVQFKPHAPALLYVQTRQKNISNDIVGTKSIYRFCSADLPRNIKAHRHFTYPSD